MTNVNSKNSSIYFGIVVIIIGIGKRIRNCEYVCMFWCFQEL